MSTRVTRRRTSETGLLDLGTARQAILDLAQQMRASDAEGRARLQRVGEAIVGAFRHSTHLHAGLRPFLQEHAAELIPAWLSERGDGRPAEPAAALRARAIAALLPEERAAAVAHEGEGLLKELDALGRADLVAQVLGIPLSLLSDRSAQCRATACEALLHLGGAFESEAALEVRRRLEEAIRQALEVEDEAAVYPLLASVGTMLVDARIRHGSLPDAMPTLDLLRRHTQVKEGGSPRRAEHAFQALERVASSGGFAVVLERLREGDPDALRVVESLDVAATRFLVGQIRATEGMATRVRFARTIARGGPNAAAVLIEATQQTTAPSDVLRLMQVLPSAAPEKMMEGALDGLLRHAAIAVRKRAALMLAELATPRAGSLVLGALRDEAEATVRATMAESLGVLRHKEAVQALLDLADGRSEADDVRSEACLALGRIADRAAIPALVRLSSGGGGGLSSLFRASVKEVRVAATRALGSYPTDLAAREALRHALDDPLPAVRGAAKDALEKPLHVRPATRIAPVDPRAVSWKLAGSLGEVPLDQICQLIASASRSGVLTLQFEAQKAHVWFHDGVVVAADYEGKRDQAAFNAFCRQTAGHFSFRPNQEAPERRMHAPVAQCLLEACRVADEAAKGGGQAVPEPRG